MTQTLKNQIKFQIDNAALECFAEYGFKKTSMKQIAKKADISVGNIYHYYQDKKNLFYSLVTDEIIDDVKQVLYTKFKSFNQKNFSSGELSPQINELLVDILIKNPRQSIILLSGAAGTKHESFIDETVEFLTNLYFEIKNLEENNDFDYPRENIIKIIYKNLLRSISEIMKNAKNSNTLKKQLKTLLNYHLNGILSIKD